MNNNYYENIEINNHDALYTIIKIVLLLLTLQITRIVLKQIAFLFFYYSKFNEMVVSIITIFFLILFILYKSRKEKINLGVFSYMKSSESKGYYIVVTICILMLSIISSDIINNPSIENIINLIYYSMIIPIYEEIIFRSYIWENLKKDNKNEWKRYIITTILASLFQIGYIDTINMSMGNMVNIIFIKCILMLSCSFFIGSFKYEIKNSYSCMLIHSFITILLKK